MLNRHDDTYKDDMNFQDYETLSIPYEPFERQRPPLSAPQSGNIPSAGNFPPGFNYPGGGFNPPGFNSPIGSNTQSGMPKSPPPNYIPNKNDSGVQSFNQGNYGPGTKAVSQNSIRFCLYKYTYIWEVNGRSYWAFLLNIDRVSVSGFRWLGRRWVYFGVDLRRIDSFVCYNRSALVDDCNNCKNLKQDDISLLSSKKDYSLLGDRDVYTQTLASIDIPEIREDFLTQTTDYIDNNSLKSEIPCIKARNIRYRISLEVTYPSTYCGVLKNKINELANEASNDAYKILSSTRNIDGYSNPLETFNLSVSLIPEALNTFSKSFDSKVRSLASDADIYKDIAYSIREEKDHANWKPYSYNPY
jgi:hypothetical protein